MINISCPNCNWSSSVDDKLLGQIAECPSCGNDFTIGGKNSQESVSQQEVAESSTARLKSKSRIKTTVRLNKTAVERPVTRRPGKAAKTEKPPRNSKAILKIVGGVVLVIGILVFMYFDHENNRQENWKMNDKVIAHLTKENFPEPWYKLLTVDSAQFNHYSALNMCKRINSKKSFNAKYSEDEYAENLLKNMSYDLSFLRTDFKPDKISIADFSGYWKTYIKSRDFFLYYLFDKNGNYKLIAFDSYTKPNEVSPSDVQLKTGSIKIDKNSVVWEDGERETIKVLLQDHLVFETKDSSIIHYRKVSAQEISDLEKIGFK